MSAQPRPAAHRWLPVCAALLLATPALAQTLTPGWAPLAPAGELPPRGGKQRMAYDAVRRQLVLVTPDSTWVFDGTAWVKKAGEVVPDAADVVYDAARERVVAFGGYVGGTWLWDGSVWTRWTPPDGVEPPGRIHHGMAYDARRQRVVVFSGHRDGSYLHDDLWEWDGARWTRVTLSPRPPARQLAGFTYDAERGQVVLFGGLKWFTGDTFADTWVYDGTAWTQRSVSGPSARYGQALAYDASRGRAVLFGGEWWEGSTQRQTSETWEWDGAAWTRVTSQGAPPSARERAALAYDADRQRVVLFGGYDAAAAAWTQDTWEYRVTGVLPPGGGPDGGVGTPTDGGAQEPPPGTDGGGCAAAAGDALAGALALLALLAARRLRPAAGSAR